MRLHLSVCVHDVKYGPVVYVYGHMVPWRHCTGPLAYPAARCSPMMNKEGRRYSYLEGIMYDNAID